MSFAVKPLAMAAKPIAAAARYTVDVLNEIATDVATAGVTENPPVATVARQFTPRSSLDVSHRPARPACETPEAAEGAKTADSTGSDSDGPIGQLEAMATGRLDELPVASHAWALTAEQARAGTAVWRAAHATSQRLYAQRAARANGQRVALPAMSSPDIERQRVAVLRRATAASRTCSCAASRCDGSATAATDEVESGTCAECNFSDADDDDGDGADGRAASSHATHAGSGASSCDGTFADASADGDGDAVDAAAMRALAMFRRVQRFSSSRSSAAAKAAESRAAVLLSPLAECVGDAEAEGADLASSYCSVAGRGEGKGSTPAPQLRQQLALADAESLAPSPRMMLQPATPAPLMARPAAMDAQRTPAACTRMSFADFVAVE